MNRHLKILHLFDFYLPGTMNWAYQMLRHTPSVQQWIAAPWMVRNEYFDPEFRFFVRNFQRKTGWLPESEWRFQPLSTNLIRLEKYWPLYKRWLYHQLRHNPPDMLHAHFGPLGCHYLDLAQKLDIPMLVSFYGYDFQRLTFEKPAFRRRYVQLFEQAAAFTTTGPFTPKLLEEQGCPPEKIIPLPLSIVPADFPFVPRAKHSGQLRLVQVATITEKKGQLDTLEALRRVLPGCPDIQLLLAGEKQDKSLVQQMKQFIKSHRLEKHIRWSDAVPHAELSSFLSRADVFIHPSRRTARLDSEGSPVVILEAQAAGLPVLSTLHADIPAQVIHEKTGLLTAENDPAALAENIRRFYWMDNVEYQRFSLNAHQHVQQHFDVENAGRKLLEIYSGILKVFSEA